MLLLFVGDLCLVLVFLLFSTLFCNHHDEEERAGCSALTVFPMSCGCQCSVALPHGAVCRPQCVIVFFPDHTHLLVLVQAM